MVYYNKAWHLIDTGHGSIKYVNDYGKGEDDNEYLSSFDMTWKAWTLSEQDRPMVIENVIPVKPTDKAAYSTH
ncbi:hypothetical protein [Anaerocolumna sp.]|uniref:hypothetical protein n=1 Tax=Anaerocolumna sp. TaxID=2041569 RepID=UPI0028A7FB6E|nr:hypothetical protein [Anaerocolumna sp.]